jgi:transitional endoplasmic reticulum ATPase
MASVTKAAFFQMSASSMYSSMVGDSEAGSNARLTSVRAVFKNACAAAPSIIFLDEMEALVGSRTLGKSAGEAVQERILSTLLNEMDGIENAGNILVLVYFLNPGSNKPPRSC